MFYFDPIYFVFLTPALLLAMWAQLKVKSAYASASRVPVQSGMSGRETAAAILQANGVSNVNIEMTQGVLSDHYDPSKKVLRLSPDVYQGRSLAAVGIAAHEVGHALQDKFGYLPLHLRNGIVPLAAVGGQLFFVLVALGLMLQAPSLVLVGVGLFSLTVLFQVINLPVEFNASSRARSSLLKLGLVSSDEERGVGKVLNAAALTYVAGTVTAILTLLYYLFRLGLLGRSRDEG